MTSTSVDSSTARAAAPSAASPIRVWTLAFLAILLDGFDTTSISFVVPLLAREWGLAPAAFTPAFVSTSVGAVLGYVLSGWLAAALGRRALIIASVFFFGIASWATVFSMSVATLAWIRFVTGIGLGAVLPAAISLAVAQAPAARREAVTVGVAAGLGLGALLGGVLGGKLMAAFGWTAVFHAGGVLPLLLLPLLWWGLPRDVDGAAGAPGTAPAGQVQQLFAGDLRRHTLLLWGFSFFLFTAFYALTFWVPSLLGSFGFAPGEAPLGAAALGGGGVIGSLLLIPLSLWLGTRRVLVVATLIGIGLIAVIAKADLDRARLLMTIAGLGACLVCGTLGQSALAVALYPPAARTTGVGWSAALGRIGSIVGPAVGGALLASGQVPRDVVLTACAPLAIGFAVLLLLGRAERAR